ncbi:unnamed protein product [Symbiodinium sp. KB8]|nr:unnamed protein product [Symbiodinium sp. KB8]
MRQAFAAKFGELEDKHIPAKEFIEKKLGELESGEFRAEPLTEIISRDEVDPDTLLPHWDSLKKGGSKTAMPSAPEQLRLRLTVLQNTLIMIQLRRPGRRELEDVTFALFEKYKEYLLLLWSPFQRGLWLASVMATAAYSAYKEPSVKGKGAKGNGKCKDNKGAKKLKEGSDRLGPNLVLCYNLITPATATPPAMSPLSAGTQPLRVLYLFSGTPRKPDMAACLQQLAAAWTLDLKTECVDVKRSAKHDLSLPTVRKSYLDRIAAKEFDAVLLSPPCASFSRASWAITSEDPAVCGATNSLEVWKS